MNGNIRASNRIKKQLVKMGIQVSGRSRKFNPENHPYSPLSGRLFKALSDDDLAAVDTMLHNRHEALRARNYRKADELQGDLLRKGIEVDDFNCCWRFKEDNTFAPANWQVDF